MAVNIFAIPVYHKPRGQVDAAIVGGSTRSGLAETLIRNGIFRATGATRPIVTIQSVALMPIAITSAAPGVPPQAGSTGVVLSLTDQPMTQRANVQQAVARRRY